MADYVEVVAPHLDPALVDSDAGGELDRLLGELPPFTPAGFECRLAADSSRADFQFFLNRPEELLAAAKSRPEWSELRDRVARCAEHVGGIWLEFDLAGRSSTPRLPSVFLRVASSPQALARIAEAIVAGPRLDELSSSLHRVRAFLPEGSEISHLGAMWGREGVPSRFRVARLGRGDAPTLLGRLGAHHVAQALDEATADLVSECDSYALLLDGAFGPELGLECFVSGGDLATWRAVLERLGRRGFACEHKAAALLRWPGAQTARPDRPWPRNIALGDSLLAGRALSVFVRSINHLKLTFDRTRLQSAKAYLAFEHQWVSAAVLRTMLAR